MPVGRHCLAAGGSLVDLRVDALAHLVVEKLGIGQHRGLEMLLEQGTKLESVGLVQFGGGVTGSRRGGQVPARNSSARSPVSWPSIQAV